MYIHIGYAMRTTDNLVITEGVQSGTFIFR